MDRINEAAELIKKIARVILDPTGGKDMPAEERNAKRKGAVEDLDSAVDILASFADAAEGGIDLIGLKNKY